MSGLEVQVRTRSKVQDYRFVAPEQPTDRWWEKRYGQWTDFARPTVLVEPRRFFVSGISAGRTDSKGARIHYALLGTVDDAARGAAGQVLGYLCDVLGRTGSLDEIGACLDTLSDDDWNVALRGDPAALGDVQRRLMKLISDWAARTQYQPVSGPFWLSAAQPQVFARLAGTAANVVMLEDGGPERALYLNLASASELTQLTRPGSGIVCRAEDRPPKPRSRLPAGMALAAGGLVCVALLVWLVTS